MNGHASINRLYRLVWSPVRQDFVAVAEHTRSRGKCAGRTAGGALRAVLAALGMMGLATAHADPGGIATTAPAPTQLPTGGRVTSGAANIGQTGGPSAPVLNVDQSSARAVIDWSTFNLGAAAQVHFNQPGANSATLNRVLDNNPSQIFGRITAPGQVFFSNPNGLVFAPGASVDVGALTATTHAISNADFMSGMLTFTRNGATGSVVNEGSIAARRGGYVALLAPEVRNEGVIVARAGTAAGDAVTVSGNGAFASKNAGTNLGYTVSNLALSGADAGNYFMNAPAGSVSGTNGTITPAALTLAASGDSKVYDTTRASNAAVIVSGLMTGDSIDGVTQSFDSKNAGTRQLGVDAGWVLNDGNGGNNYVVGTVAAAGVIAKATLAVTGASAANKVYDATPLATVSGGAVSALGADAVTLDTHAATGSFADGSVGTGKAVTASGYAIGGADAGNYALLQPVGLTGDITPAPPPVVVPPPVAAPPTQPAAPHGGVDPSATLDAAIRPSAPADFAAKVDATRNGWARPAVPAWNDLFAASVGMTGVEVGSLASAPDADASVVRIELVGDAAHEGFKAVPPKPLDDALKADAAQAIVTLESGETLPAWLQFDGESRVFHASAVPSGALPLRARLRAGARSWVLLVEATPR